MSALCKRGPEAGAGTPTHSALVSGPGPSSRPGDVQAAPRGPLLALALALALALKAAPWLAARHRRASTFYNLLTRFFILSCLSLFSSLIPGMSSSPLPSPV